jgi:hypothetical protein
MPNDLNINDPELEEDEIIEPDPEDDQELDESTVDFFKSLAVTTPTETDLEAIDPEATDPAGISVNNEDVQKILKAIKIAKKDWLGNVKEGKTDNTDKPGQSRIRQMQSNTGAYGAAWCASAVTTWWKEAGLLPKGWNGSASVVAWTDWAKKNKRWSKTPMPGAAIIYDFVGGRSAGGDHIGLCVAVEGGKVASIDGNYGDKVSAYQPNLATVLGYVLPVTSSTSDVLNELSSEFKLADFKKSKPQKYS